MIENNLPVVIYTADGTTTQWDISYQFSNAAEIALYISHNDVLTAIPAADYYVDVDEGTITYPVQAEGVDDPVTPVPQGDLVVIERANAITQEEDSSTTAFKSADVERIADKLTKICQELSYRLGRTISYNPTVPDNEMVTDASEFKAGIEADTTAAIAAHNSSNTSHTDIRTLANNAMPKSGGTFTGSVSMANGTSINFPHYKIGENGSGNAIIGDNNGNGLVVLPNGEGAALFTNGGSEYSELVRFKDVKSTYSPSSTYPMDGVAVAQAVAGEASARETAVSGEAYNRQLADANLQGQITALGTSKQDALTSTQLEAVNSGINSTKVAAIATNTSDISTINGKIPSEATISNQLADKSYVNDAINSVAAYYVTSDAQGSSFATKAALEAGPWYYDGTTRTPTTNDYALVAEDETHDDKLARYTYTGSQWAFQYTFNDMTFTQDQLNAIDSGITSAKVSSYDSHIASTSNPHSVTKAQVGLGDADNTSDLNKPISTATQTALNAKASSADNTSIVDNGTAITTVGVKEQNASAVIKKWVGTKAQYDAITTKDSNTEYTTTDENDGQAIVIDNALSSSSENPIQNKVIKTALDGKQATITGAISNITSSNLTASKALTSDSSGKVVASSVTATELGYVSGVTSAIQTQLNGKQPTLPAGTTGYYLQKTADGVTWADVPGGGGSVTVDGTTIDDANDVLSAIGLKETRNSDSIKLWVGTTAQYNAISTKDSNTLYVKTDVPTYYQTVSNLVTSVSSSSTDSQYPSAKLFYDTCGDIETLINAL